MTAFQKFWNSEIENLLQELNASKSLQENIIDTLNNSARTGIYVNQIVNALRIGLSIKDGNQNIALVASMQSGKSGTIYFLCNYVLPALGIISQYESILFVTSMRDTDLYNQNCINLQSDYFDCTSKKMTQSNIKVLKMSDFFNHPNPHKVVKDYDVNLIIRDEDQYGCGEDSNFQIAFFDELRQRLPDIKLLAVSATPYDILDAQYTQAADVDVVIGVRSDEYYGISEMLNDGLIEDLPEGFKPLQTQGKGLEATNSVHPKVLEYVKYLNSFDTGLGIIRESNTLKALELRRLLREICKSTCDIIAIGSDSTCDFSINDGIKEVSDLVLKRGKRVVLVVVQALSAGKDLGVLKEKVRFGIETRASQLANGAQGITGRFCGYHKNRSFKILASVSLLEHYAKFEQDYEVFSDEDWRNDLHDNNVKGLSTHTKLVNTQRKGIFTPITDITTIDAKCLNSKEGREILNFLDDKGYNKLKYFFTKEFYGAETKGTQFKQKNVTVRIASGYNQSSNRVYKNWNCNLDKDFGSVFFKKKKYNFGILISNIPVSDERNTLGFCGVKVLTAGEIENRTQITNVLNQSMYKDKSA